MQFATDAVGHARLRGHVRVAMDDHPNFATVFGVGQVFGVDDEVFAGGAGIVAARHVFLAPAFGNHDAAAFLGELGSGVRLYLFDQGFVHGY